MPDDLPVDTVGWGSFRSLEILFRAACSRSPKDEINWGDYHPLYCSSIQPGPPTPICDEIAGEFERVLKKYRPVSPIRDSKIGDAVSHGTANSIEYLLLMNREVGSDFADRQRFLYAMRRGFDRSKKLIDTNMDMRSLSR